MGEYAEYMLNGDDCEGCGEYLGDGPGYPQYCAACMREMNRLKSPPPAAVKPKLFKCPGCAKSFTTALGAADHERMAHAPYRIKRSAS